LKNSRKRLSLDSSRSTSRNPICNEDSEAASLFHLIEIKVREIAASIPAYADLEELRSAGGFGLAIALRTWKANGRASIETFASRHIRWAILGALRLAKRRREFERISIETIATNEISTSEPNPLDEMIGRETQQRICSVLNLLPAVDAALLRLHYFDGLSLRQAATAAAWSQSGKASTHTDILRRLKAFLTANRQV
jgi:RNA polymerase sigma factor (sigma-70 family)